MVHRARGSGRPCQQRHACSSRRTATWERSPGVQADSQSCLLPAAARVQAQRAQDLVQALAQIHLQSRGCLAHTRTGLHALAGQHPARLLTLAGLAYPGALHTCTYACWPCTHLHLCRRAGRGTGLRPACQHTYARWPCTHLHSCARAGQCAGLRRREAPALRRQRMHAFLDGVFHDKPVAGREQAAVRQQRVRRRPKTCARPVQSTCAGRACRGQQRISTCPAPHMETAQAALRGKSTHGLVRQQARRGWLPALLSQLEGLHRREHNVARHEAHVPAPPPPRARMQHL